ncbi:Uncharacterised protein [Acinetobacter baumannii]|nr:Uncharacterised protein [Acinetobacter baumannii]
MRGSKASRRPSPIKLIASTASTIAAPAGIHCQGYCSRMLTLRATLIRLPQVAVGGCTPRPRKESPASSKIALATPKVAYTTSTSTVFGSRWRRMMRLGRAPMATAADTKSCSRRDRSLALTSRQTRGQLSRPMMKMVLSSPGPMIAASASSTMMLGKVITMSTKRMMRPSVIPPK